MDSGLIFLRFPAGAMEGRGKLGQPPVGYGGLSVQDVREANPPGIKSEA